MDRFTALKVFCSVVERRGFAAAARELGLSNAAVSKNIGELEARLGVRLLTRTTRKMSLSEAGAAYYTEAARILDLLVQADDAAAGMTSQLRGKLKISAPMSFGLRVLTPLIPQFLTMHPEVEIDLVLSDTVVDLVGGHFDVAIRGYGTLPDSGLIARRLTELNRVVCGSPSYFSQKGIPRDLKDLSDHNCLIYTLSNELKGWSLSRNGRVQHVIVTGHLQINNSLALRDAALAGFGIAYIPKIYIDDALADGRLVTVLNDWLAVEQWIYAIYPPGRYKTNRVGTFVDFVAEHLGAQKQS